MKPSPIVVPLLCIIVVAARTAFAAQVAPAPAPLATSTVPGLAQFGTVPGTAADGGALSSEAATARANEASAQATANAALPAATAASTYAPLTSPSLNGLASVNGPAGTPRGLVWGANGVGTRWSLQTDASDNLCLYAFADTAAYLDAPVCFMRNAQELQIYGQVVATVFGSGPDSNGLGPIFSTVNNGPATGAIGFTNQYTSHADAPNFDVGEESISVFDVTAWNANQLSAGANASGPAQYEGFRVASSPNDQTHNFGTAVEEWNIVNRGRDVGFKRDRSLQPVTGGLLMVSEAAAYDAATGGQGLNANYAFSLSHSGGLNSTGFQTKFYDGYQCEPNAVAGLTGRCAYFTGDITGVASQIPYGPMQFDGAWLHGLDTTLATFGDGLAVHLAAGQKVGIGSATIGAGSGANGNLVLSAAGTGTVQSTSPLAAPSFTGNLTGNVTGTASGNDALGLSAAETARATAAEGTLTTNVGSNTAAIALKAPIASPTFTGTVAAPVHSAPAGTATVLATVQPTVASTGYGSSYFIPLASTAGLTTGMGVTGTGIPANAQAMYVSGGTASVTQAAAATVALGASNVPVSNSTGIYQGMAAFDTTTSTRLNSTALVSGVLGGASAPANLTGLIASALASGGNTLALTSGGAACLPGMTLVDQTTPTVGLQQVQSSTATSVKLSGTTSAAIATTDTVQCYPTVLLSVQSVETTGGIPSGDSLLFTPAVTVTQPMASGLASGTSVTFTPTSASLAASGLTTNGALNLGEGALTVGLGSIRFTGGTAYNTVGTQSQTLIGNGAGANMPPNEALLTAVGFQAGGQLISQNSESTLYGFGAARLLVSGNYVNAFGINSLGSCVYGCTHDIAFGTDAMRNTLSAFSDVAIGDQVMITYTGADSVVIGEGNALGNTSASPSGSFLTGVGYGVFGSASITTALERRGFRRDWPWHLSRPAIRTLRSGFRLATP